jgi:hypothetical protein
MNLHTLEGDSPSTASSGVTMVFALFVAAGVVATRVDDEEVRDEDDSRLRRPRDDWPDISSRRKRASSIFWFGGQKYFLPYRLHASAKP